jgi:hypothetical protein
MRVILFLLLFITIIYPVKSQSPPGWSVLPAYTIGYKFASSWQLTGKVEVNNQNIPNGFESLFNVSRYTSEIGLQTFISYKLSAVSGLAVGYQWSTETHTVLPQYSLVVYLAQLKLGNRIRNEIRFRNNEIDSYRLRYRLATQIPLNGNKLDEGEMYLKTQLEQLVRYKSEAQNYEIRTSLVAGNLVNNRNKLEYGFEFQARHSMRSSGWDSVIQLVAGWYFSI